MIDNFLLLCYNDISQKLKEITILLVVGLLLLIALLLVFFFSASRLSKYEPREGDDIFLDKEEKH